MTLPVTRAQELFNRHIEALSDPDAKVPEFTVHAILREAKAEMANANAEGRWALWGLIGLAKQRLTEDPALAPRARNILLQEALDAHRNALRYRNDFNDLCSVGKVLAELGRATESIEYFTRAEQMVPRNTPNHVILLVNLAEALRDQGDTEAGVAAIHRALAIEADDAMSLLRIATALARFGFDDDAVELLARASARAQGQDRGDAPGSPAGAPTGARCGPCAGHGARPR